MKNFLTAAIVAATLGVAGAALAEYPERTIELTIQAGAGDDTVDG